MKTFHVTDLHSSNAYYFFLEMTICHDVKNPSWKLKNISLATICSFLAAKSIMYVTASVAWKPVTFCNAKILNEQLCLLVKLGLKDKFHMARW